MRHRRGACTAVLTGLAGFVALQAGLAGLLAGKLSWLRSPDYGHKVSRLREAINTSDCPQTIVMLGSSRTAYGLKGTAIEPILTQHERHQVIVYNFGLHGAGPLSYLINLRRLLNDGIRPDLLLIEVLPPLLSNRGPFNDTSEEHLPTASLRRDELALVQRYADNRSVSQADWWLGWCLPCYHHRLALISHSLPTLLDLQERLDGNRQLDASGWMPVHAVLRAPARRRAALAWARKDYTERLAGFELGGPNVEALEETLELCRRERINTALVLMPEGPEFRSWYPPGVMPQVRRLLGQLSRRHAMPIIDARDWIASEDAFLDSHHLLPEGAEVFSDRLAHEVLSLVLPRSPAVEIAERGGD